MKNKNLYFIKIHNFSTKLNIKKFYEKWFWETKKKNETVK